MGKANILSYLPIIIVSIIFLISILYCYICYSKTGQNLKKLFNILSGFKKDELNFRFKEFDSALAGNDYVKSIWEEFKSTLVFSESVALVDDNNQEYSYQNVSSSVQDIQTAVDPLYFFNEETLIKSRFNYKLIQTMPTILTGCGPLFTFLNIALAFRIIDFSTPENTLSSISEFMVSMQIAALVSVVAVGASLIYLFLERVLYNKICKSKLINVQNRINSLFTSTSSEKFLFEMLRESKIQNNSTQNIINSIPIQFKSAFNESVGANLVPYLENLIFGLNQLNNELKNNTKTNNTDVVDELF